MHASRSAPEPSAAQALRPSPTTEGRLGSDRIPLLHWGRAERPRWPMTNRIRRSAAPLPEVGRTSLSLSSLSRGPSAPKGSEERMYEHAKQERERPTRLIASVGTLRLRNTHRTHVQFSPMANETHNSRRCCTCLKEACACACHACLACGIRHRMCGGTRVSRPPETFPNNADAEGEGHDQSRLAIADAHGAS